MARDSPLHEGLSRLLPHAIDLLERNEGVPLAPRARFGAGPGRRSDGCIGTQSSGSRESQTKPRAKGTSDSCGKYAEGWEAPRRAPCIHFWKRTHSGGCHIKSATRTLRPSGTARGAA